MPIEDFPSSLGELGEAALSEGQSAPGEDNLRVSVRGPVTAAHGTAGLHMAIGDRTRVAVCQLEEPLQRQTTDTVKDDVPSAQATPVWYFPSDGSVPKNRYLDAGTHSRSMRLYHVDAVPGDQRDEITALSAGQPGELGIPKLTTGDRVLAVLNNQSGRWEILAPAEDVWRFELKTALVPGEDPDVPGTAEAYLVVYDASQSCYVTTGVEFPVADFLGCFDAEPGCRGYAKRLADSSPDVGWEVIALGSTPAGSSSGP